MRWQPFIIVGGAYADDTKPWSVQDTCNYIPVAAERGGTRSPTMLRGAPGYTLFADLGSNAPVRGMHNAEGLLLVVSGTTLYTVGPDGVAVARGTIPGVRRVSMAHNQVTGGNQVAIANGLSGYVYDTRDSTLTHVTDEGFPGAVSFDFADGYIVAIEPGRRFAFTSMLADASAYNTLDRYEAEGSPDKLVGQLVTHREWWLFGERTIEPYINTGASTGTWQRAEGTVIEVGCASGETIAKLDNTAFWLGNDGIVYRAAGYAPKRISTHAIEQDIARSNMAEAFAFTFEDRGHSIYYLTFPGGRTWGYDAASGEWHRRQSDGMSRWRLSDLIRWNGQWIGGDYANGKLYRLGWDVQHEDGNVLERRRTAGVLHDSGNRIIVNGLKLVLDTGAQQPSAVKIGGDLVDGDVGTPVDFQYTVSGGVKPYALSIVAGALPDGLTMDAQGHVTGTLTTEETAAWTVQARDAFGKTATLNDACAVTPPPKTYFISTGGTSYIDIRGNRASGMTVSQTVSDTQDGELSAFVRNGMRLITANGYGNCHVYDRDSLDADFALSGTFAGLQRFGAVVSPDGQWLIDNANVFSYQGGGQWTPVGASNSNVVRYGRFSQDSRYVAYTIDYFPTIICVYSVNAGSLSEIHRETTSANRLSLAWSARNELVFVGDDGSSFVLQFYHSSVTTRSIDVVTDIAQMTGYAQDYSGVSWHPSGNYFAIGGPYQGGPTIYSWNGVNATQIQQIGFNYCSQVQYSQDGSTFVCNVSGDTDTQGIQVFNVEANGTLTDITSQMVVASLFAKFALVESVDYHMAYNS